MLLYNIQSLEKKVKGKFERFKKEKDGEVFLRGVVGLWGYGVVGLWDGGIVGLWGCGVVGL